MEEILRIGRMRWLGHVNCMEDNWIPKQEMDWLPENSKRKRTRPRITWKKAV